MKRILLAIILLLAIFLRTTGLEYYPVGFTPDEASFGYDAYSILKTGKDQWGHYMPLVLESFGDFKPPLYAYLTVPSVTVFGLNKLAVRLPNALLGAAAVFVVYLLVKELLSVVDTKKRDKDFSESVAIIASLALAISPWHVMLSRGAFEANLTTFFLPLGVYFFLRSFKKQRYLYLSALVFGINLFSYHSARLITPLIVVFLALIYRKELKKVEKSLIVKSTMVFSVFLLLVFYTLTIGGAKRAKDISIASGALNQASDERISAIFQGMNPTTARLFHNKYLVMVRRFAENYTQYTSYRFLFVDGPAEATYGMIPGRGVLYWYELIFLIGFVYSFFSKKHKKSLYIIVFWIIIAPIPASLTTGSGFAANRAAVMMPGLQIASALGAYTLFELLKNNTKKTSIVKITKLIYISSVIMFLVFFLEDYFVLSPVKAAKSMLYGHLDAVQYASSINVSGARIVDKSLSEPHIYVAFANKWDPGDYQRQSRDWLRYKQKELLFVDQLGEYKLGNYVFKNIETDDLQINGNLIVGKPDNFKVEVTPVKTFYYPNGDVSVYVVETGGQAYAFKD